MGKVTVNTELKVCCLCGKFIEGWGNDPWPVNTDDNTYCCDICNATMVIPARIRQMERTKLENEYLARQAKLSFYND